MLEQVELNYCEGVEAQQAFDKHLNLQLCHMHGIHGTNNQPFHAMDTMDLQLVLSEAFKHKASTLSLPQLYVA